MSPDREAWLPVLPTPRPVRCPDWTGGLWRPLKGHADELRLGLGGQLSGSSFSALGIEGLPLV